MLLSPLPQCPKQRHPFALGASPLKCCLCSKQRNKPRRRLFCEPHLFFFFPSFFLVPPGDRMKRDACAATIALLLLSAAHCNGQLVGVDRNLLPREPRSSRTSPGFCWKAKKKKVRKSRQRASEIWRHLKWRRLTFFDAAFECGRKIGNKARPPLLSLARGIECTLAQAHELGGLVGTRTQEKIPL